MSDKPLTPEVTWAQRSSDSDAAKNFIYLSILAADVSDKDMKLDLQASSVTFSGFSASKKANYQVTLEFYADIDPAQSKVSHTARDVELKLQKKELNQEYWPRLLKSSQKMHFLHTNFDKWVDEDEQEGAPDDLDQFGAGGGMPGMGDGGFGGLDFSKLGGGGAGMPDLGEMGGGMGGMGDDEDDEEDDDMPDLEDEEGADKAEGSSSAVPAAAAEAASKIEEVE